MDMHLKTAVHECSDAAKKISDKLMKLAAKKPELDEIVNSVILLSDALKEIATGLAAPPREQQEQKPSIGKIVHYTNRDLDGKYPLEIQAAIITKVHNETHVSLHIFYETGECNIVNVPRTVATPGHENARGKWNWPARV